MRYQFVHLWDFPLGPVYAPAGTITTIAVKPQGAFRVEKVMATDTTDPPGSSVLLMQFLVGNQLQRPVTSGASLASFFGPTALANGLCWGVCDRGLSITMTISFVAACTFYGALFGSGAV